MSRINYIIIVMYKINKKLKITNSIGGGERNKCKNEHLLCCIVMTSTQLFPHTVSNQLNEDSKNQAVF